MANDKKNCAGDLCFDDLQVNFKHDLDCRGVRRAIRRIEEQVSVGAEMRLEG